MAKVKFLFVAFAGMLASAVLVAVPSAHAGGETWKVLSVDAPACTDGDFDMTVSFQGLDGSGGYVAHTIARSGGLIYMNEQA